MKIRKDGNRIFIEREPGDPKFRDGSWGSGESRLLYHVKKKIAAGDVENWGVLPTTFIKKRMGKDGHMVDSAQLYLRTRKPLHKDMDGDKIYIAIFNDHWAVRGIDTDFNEDGKCSLRMEMCVIAEKEVYKRSFC